jgi:glycosyltransferase involved in cell wall biosynthesis
MIDPNNPDFENSPASQKRPRFEYVLKNRNIKPLVSIITPFYNTGDVFYETVQSIMQQSFQQWEWIIVNDGSQELKSLEILDQMRNFDVRMKVIDHTSNLGLSAARNTGYILSNSEYILFLDSDDLIEPKTIEYFFWFLEINPNYSFVNAYSIGFGGKKYLWERGFHDNENNLVENNIDNTALIRKNVLIKLNGFDFKIKGGAEDWEFWMRSAANGYWGYTIKEYLKWYRTRPDHTDRWENLREEKLEQIKNSFQTNFPHLREKFPKIIPQWTSKFTPIDTFRSRINLLRKSKKRLLLILPYLAVGGVDRYNFDLITNLLNLGWEISIITTLSNDNKYLSIFGELTPDIFILPNFLTVRDYPKFINYFVHSRDFDLIMVENSLYGYLSLPFLKASFPKVPIIDVSHSLTPEWYSGGYPRLSTIFQSFIDRHIVISNQLRNWVIENGVPENKIDVIYWGLDVTKWKHDPYLAEKIRSRYDVAVKTPVIFYIARLVATKQPIMFISVMKRLRDKDVNFKAFIIGDGELRQNVVQMIEVNKLNDRVSYLGELSEDQIRSILNIGDIIFLPSQIEGIPLVFYEGMAKGLVPVGAVLGGTAELVNEECGYLLDRDLCSDEEEEITHYTNILNNLLLDQNKLEVMRKNCITRIENEFNIHQMSRRFQDAFQFIQEQPVTLPNLEDYMNSYTQLLSEYYQLQDESNEIWSQKEHLETVMTNIAHKNFWTIPPASASTFFYLTVRAIAYPFYKNLPLSFQTRIIRLKNSFKKMLSMSPQK